MHRFILDLEEDSWIAEPGWFYVLYNFGQVWDSSYQFTSEGSRAKIRSWHALGPYVSPARQLMNVMLTRQPEMCRIVLMLKGPRVFFPNGVPLARLTLLGRHALVQGLQHCQPQR